MLVVASVVAVVLYLLLILIEAGQVSRSTISLFELRRRKAARDGKAAETIRREELRGQASLLKSPLQGVLIVGLTLLVLWMLDPPMSVAVIVLGAIAYGRIARFGTMQKLASRFFARNETRVLSYIKKYESLFRLVSGKASLSRPTIPLGSREELAHLLNVSPIFSDEDTKLLESMLRFGDKMVGDIMTKKSAMVTIKPSELLGPLVLDDLHKTKHEIFPVENNGEIVGMLDIRDHMALKRKESVYARDVMHVGVVHIAETEPLDEALKVFVAAKQPYLIVVNDDEQVVGMLGLGDVVRALTGWNRR